MNAAKQLKTKKDKAYIGLTIAVWAIPRFVFLRSVTNFPSVSLKTRRGLKSDKKNAFNRQLARLKAIKYASPRRIANITWRVTSDSDP